jgi:acyl-CoA synthetase (AMP-forming)/AMP-acid ligase II
MSIVRDAEATIVLTNSLVASMATELERVAPELTELRWVSTDGDLPSANLWREDDIGGDTIALLQYTSGSTSSPKGVVLAHSNVVHNLHGVQARTRMGSESVNVGWVPPYHDMGLVGHVLCPLPRTGCPAVLMSPLSFLHRPRRWLEAMSRFRATHTAAPNFAYDLCVRTTSPATRSTLDLRSLRVALSGSEPVRLATIDRFCEAFACAGFRRAAFYPSYGLAETTVMATGPQPETKLEARFFDDAALARGSAVEVSRDRSGARGLVGCGAPVDDSVLLIVDPDTRMPVPAGSVGEVWLSGPGVARGYWNQPDLSMTAFGARLSSGGDRTFMRTGDLGFLFECELYLIGRIKELIKLRGRGYFPPELEAVVQSAHTAIRAGGVAVFGVETAEATRLVAVAEINKEALNAISGAPLDGSAIVLDIQAATMAESQISFDAIALVRPGTVPKTSSGKIQRHVCRDAFLQNELDPIHAYGRRDP